MQTSLSINDICKKCGGYKFAPYNSNLSATVKLCYCPKEDVEFTELQKKILDGLQDVRKKLRK